MERHICPIVKLQLLHLTIVSFYTRCLFLTTPSLKLSLFASSDIIGDRSRDHWTPDPLKLSL